MNSTRGRIALVVTAVVLVITLGLTYAVTRPGDASASCTEFYTDAQRRAHLAPSR